MAASDDLLSEAKSSGLFAEVTDERFDYQEDYPVLLIGRSEHPDMEPLTTDGHQYDDRPSLDCYLMIQKDGTTNTKADVVQLKKDFLKHLADANATQRFRLDVPSKTPWEDEGFIDPFNIFIAYVPLTTYETFDITA